MLCSFRNNHSKLRLHKTSTHQPRTNLCASKLQRLDGTQHNHSMILTTNAGASHLPRSEPLYSRLQFFALSSLIVSLLCKGHLRSPPAPKLIKYSLFLCFLDLFPLRKCIFSCGPQVFVYATFKLFL